MTIFFVPDNTFTWWQWHHQYLMISQLCRCLANALQWYVFLIGVAPLEWARVLHWFKRCTISQHQSKRQSFETCRVWNCKTNASAGYDVKQMSRLAPRNKNIGSGSGGGWQAHCLASLGSEQHLTGDAHFKNGGRQSGSVGFFGLQTSRLVPLTPATGCHTFHPEHSSREAWKSLVRSVFESPVAGWRRSVGVRPDRWSPPAADAERWLRLSLDRKHNWAFHFLVCTLAGAQAQVGVETQKTVGWVCSELWVACRTRRCCFQKISVTPGKNNKKTNKQD